MKGDKVVESIKKLSNFALFLKWWERYLAHTEFVIIEVKSNTALLQLPNQLLKIRRFEPVPQKSVINIIGSLKNLVKWANYDIFPGVLISNWANIYSCRIVGKRVWRNDIVHSFISFSHSATISKLLVLRHKSALVGYWITLQRQVFSILFSRQKSYLGELTLFPSYPVAVELIQVWNMGSKFEISGFIVANSGLYAII